MIQLIEILLFAITSFGVGLSGALVPGPMLTVTISDSVNNGFKAGPLVILGHFMTEIAIMLVILGGLGWIIGSKTAVFIIGTVGGLVLIFMGYNISRSHKSLSDIEKEENKQSTYGSVIGGIITSLSNPFFYVWWATVGCAFMFKGLELAGVIGLLGFVIGHWLADLSWFSVVSLFSSRGSNLMSDRSYKVAMIICGLFLVLLGCYFIYSQLNAFI